MYLNVSKCLYSSIISGLTTFLLQWRLEKACFRSRPVVVHTFNILDGFSFDSHSSSVISQPSSYAALFDEFCTFTPTTTRGDQTHEEQTTKSEDHPGNGSRRKHLLRSTSTRGSFNINNWTVTIRCWDNRLRCLVAGWDLYGNRRKGRSWDSRLQ